jgi:phosphoribosylformimino-5-aminoimidazole carboxamide ribotide isomerase
VDFYPAIDLLGGRCVRLVEGDFSRSTEYSTDPVEVAMGFAGAGARWVHVVNLDAARSGRPTNRTAIAAIAATGLLVQAGGGIRSIGDAEELFDLGVARVVVGTAVVEEPGVVEEMAGRWPGRVAAGVDHRGGEVRVRGWTEGSKLRVPDAVAAAVRAGACAVVVTDISRDGRLLGPDVAGLRELVTQAPIIASGGVRHLSDLRDLVALGPGLVGVIAGRAVYEGTLDVAKAVALCSPAGGSAVAG